MRENRVDVWRRTACTGLALLGASAGSAGLLWPEAGAALWPTPLPPLHTRCVGAMQLALAAGLWSARREPDPAAARIPLAATATWGVASTLSAAWWSPPGAGPAWLLLTGGVGAAASALLLVGDDDPAPAEHPSRAWQAAALWAGITALLLLLAPQWAALQWPWRMQPAQAGAYGAHFLGFAGAAWMLAHERRRYVRTPALHLLLVLTLGVLGASAWHHAAFNPGRPAAWLWWGSFSALALLCAQRLNAHRLHG